MSDKKTDTQLTEKKPTKLKLKRSIHSTLTVQQNGSGKSKEVKIETRKTRVIDTHAKEEAEAKAKKEAEAKAQKEAEA
ncbi:translation initiation factor IF-2 associated domain-containing protein, partial [Gallibacterium genomosp. 2]|uniref:translation initiation factor IF-2 associated domain-containing protein n=1 Tax=Gallibacterium genomosp. 2 TaxID=155517 RepID=UPI00057D3CDD